jgi:hypothetical protein
VIRDIAWLTGDDTELREAFAQPLNLAACSPRTTAS